MIKHTAANAEPDALRQMGLNFFHMFKFLKIHVLYVEWN